MKKILKSLVSKSPFLNRKVINSKNYFSTKNKLKNSTGQMKDVELENELRNIILKKNIKTIVEIGTWNGLGSTKKMLNLTKNSKTIRSFHSIESDVLCFKAAKRNLKNDLEYFH